MGTPDVERRLRSYLLALGLGIGVAGTVLALDEENGLGRLWALRTHEGRLQSSVASLVEERTERTRLTHRLRGDRQTIEHLAREKLGMVRPGEIVVRLHPPADERALSSASD
jgi:cell division protein FtsB